MTFCQKSAVNFHINSLEVYKSADIKNKDTSLLLREDFSCGDATYLPLFAFTLKLIYFFLLEAWIDTNGVTSVSTK